MYKNNYIKAYSSHLYEIITCSVEEYAHLFHHLLLNERPNDRRRQLSRDTRVLCVPMQATHMNNQINRQKKRQNVATTHIKQLGSAVFVSLQPPTHR